MERDSDRERQSKEKGKEARKEKWKRHEKAKLGASASLLLSFPVNSSQLTSNQLISPHLDSTCLVFSCFSSI